MFKPQQQARGISSQSTTPQPVKGARPYLHLVSIVLETIEYALRNFEVAELDLLEGVDWFNKLVFEDKGFSAAIHYRQFLNEPDINPAPFLKVSAKKPYINRRFPG